MFSKSNASFYIQSTNSSASPSSMNLVWFDFFSFSYLNKYVVAVFICISLCLMMLSISMRLWFIYIIFFGEVSDDIICPNIIELFVFVSLSFRNSQYSLEYKSFVRPWFLNITSPYVDCVFKSVFHKENYLLLIKSSILIFKNRLCSSFCI